MTQFVRFLQEEEGATAIEYALIAALIAVAIIGALTTVGGDVSSLFNKVGNELNSAANKSS